MSEFRPIEPKEDTHKMEMGTTIAVVTRPPTKKAQFFPRITKDPIKEIIEEQP